MSNSYVVINDSQDTVLKIQSLCDEFQSLHFVASANNYHDGLNAILEFQPKLVFLEIDPKDKKSNLSLSLINELFRYLKVIPKIVVTAKSTDKSYESIKFGVFEYLLFPLIRSDFRKTILKFERDSEKDFHTEKIEAEVPISVDNDGSGKVLKAQSLTICIKSYGDYRYIDANDIFYFQADSNSTDIHLNNGEMVTAFKTLKHFENILPSNFYRIHNSYILNTNHLSRIHIGNSVCFIKNSTIKIPFSKSYRGNIDQIILAISSSDYLEI